MKSQIILLILSISFQMILNNKIRSQYKNKKKISHKTKKAIKINLISNKLKKENNKIHRSKKVSREYDHLESFNETFLNEFSKKYTGKFLVRKIRNKEQIEPISLKKLTLNKYGLYISSVDSEEESLDNLDEMITLDEMIDQEEIEQLKNQMPVLQQVISEVDSEVIADTHDPEQKAVFQCFQIAHQKDDGYVIEICDQDYNIDKSGQLIKFRDQIIHKVIQNVEIKNGLKYTRTIVSSQDGNDLIEDGFEGWNYQDQNSWKGLCKEGLQQSPINIEDEQVLLTSNQLQLITGYHGDANAFSVRGPNDYFLIGQFGYSLYQNQLEEEHQYYCAYRIDFKFNSEHTLLETPRDIEVLVYHKLNSENEIRESAVNHKQDNNCDSFISALVNEWKNIKSEAEERAILSQNTDLIVSFMISASEALAEDTEGIFWQGLRQVAFSNPSQMKKYSTKTLIDADSKQIENSELLGSLEGLIDLGLSQKFKHSFYFYMGSLSQPLCTEDVKRIIMYENIEITKKSFEYLQQQILNGFNNKANKRSVTSQSKANSASYKVYKHVDVSNKDNCDPVEKMRKFQIKDANNKLSGEEKREYDKLIANLDKYKNVYSNFMRKKVKETNEEDKENKDQLKNIVTKFTHDVNINTNIRHIHKIPKKLAQKIFNGETIENGKTINLNSGVSITYLGKNKEAYTSETKKMKAADEKIKQNIELANQLIEMHDKGLDVDKKINTEAKKQADLAAQSKQNNNQKK